MVDNQLQEHVARYDVNINQEVKNSRTVFLIITENQKGGLGFTVHYEKDVIYSVSFLNNEFFELPEEKLYKVVGSILDGGYKVTKSIFLKKKTLKIITAENDTIIPERILEDVNADDMYKNVPRPFKRK